MNCYAFQLINQEAIKYRDTLKREAALKAKNLTSLRDAKSKIEAMLRGAA